MAKVILDPGHGGGEVGDYYGNRREKNDNLLLAQKVGQFLELQGIDVIYTRTADSYLSIMDRLRLIRENGGDLLVSLHRISGRSYSTAHGLDFFIRDKDEKAREAANAIGKALYSVGYTTFGVIIRTDIPLLNEAPMPAVMVGIGYIGTEQENQFFDRNFIPIAEGIATGILHYLTLNSEGVKEQALKPMSQCYRYRVVAGEYRSYDKALEKQLMLLNLGIPADLAGTPNCVTVYTGITEQLDEAVMLERKLRELGFRTMIVIV